MNFHRQDLFSCVLNLGRTPLVTAGGDPRFVLKIKEAGGDFGQSQCGGLTIFFLKIFKLCSKKIYRRETIMK